METSKQNWDRRIALTINEVKQVKEENGEIKDVNPTKKEAPLVPTKEIGNGSKYESFSDKVGVHQN